MENETISNLNSTETWNQSASHLNRTDIAAESWHLENNTASLRNRSLIPVLFTSTQEQVLNIMFVLLVGFYSLLSQTSVIVTIVRTSTLHIPHFFIVLGMCISDSILLVIITIAVTWQHITGGVSPGKNSTCAVCNKNTCKVLLFHHKWNLVSLIKQKPL